MKAFKINFPIKYQGEAIYLGGNDKLLKIGFGRSEYYFFLNTRLVLGILLLILFTMAFLLIRSLLTETNTGVGVVSYQSSSHTRLVGYTPDAQTEDVVGYFISYFENKDLAAIETSQKALREKFIVEKQLLITKFLLEEKVSRPDQLSDAGKLKLARQISNMFISTILDNLNTENHVYQYFTADANFRKIETAIMEQIKFHVPASITLAQSALETAYGRRVINNNYFGIKDKSGETSPIATTEYYNETEFKANKHKIVSYTIIKRGGQTLYKCTVRDSFVSYATAWESFRAHSIFLIENERYAPLFTGGKNFESWADRIGSTKYGGVGYATSPIYGELLKKIIKRYQLHLLDF